MPEPDAGDDGSVDVMGDTVIAGAMFEDGAGMGFDSPSNESALDSGAAYVFR